VINNNTTKKSATFESEAAAVAAAVAAIGRGESVDLGLAQINSKNLPALGLSVDQVFRPLHQPGCRGNHSGCRL
jgi:type IV secretion system protein VirB1